MRAKKRVWAGWETPATTWPMRHCGRAIDYHAARDEYYGRESSLGILYSQTPRTPDVFRCVWPICLESGSPQSLLPTKRRFLWITVRNMLLTSRDHMRDVCPFPPWRSPTCVHSGPSATWGCKSRSLLSAALVLSLHCAIILQHPSISRKL